MIAPKISRNVPGINAHERELPPGRMATRINVSPSPRKRSPPLSTPVTSSSTEIVPRVSITPAGMIAHQRVLSVKYTQRKAAANPAKKMKPPKASNGGGRSEDTDHPKNTKPGNAAHHSNKEAIEEVCRYTTPDHAPKDSTDIRNNIQAVEQGQRSEEDQDAAYP
jgi:hypothetical protein